MAKARQTTSKKPQNGAATPKKAAKRPKKNGYPVRLEVTSPDNSDPIDRCFYACGVGAKGKDVVGYLAAPENTTGDPEPFDGDSFHTPDGEQWHLRFQVPEQYVVDNGRGWVLHVELDVPDPDEQEPFEVDYELTVNCPDPIPDCLSHKLKSGTCRKLKLGKPPTQQLAFLVKKVKFVGSGGGSNIRLVGYLKVQGQTYSGEYRHIRGRPRKWELVFTVPLWVTGNYSARVHTVGGRERANRKGFLPLAGPGT